MIVTEHLWYYGYMVRNKMLDEIRADYVLLAKAKGIKIPYYAGTLYEKYHAIISEYYGDFGNAYHGRNLCGRDCFSYPE